MTPVNASLATALGLVAGLLTTLAWLPQLVRTSRTRSARDFSWGWMALFAAGVGIWLVFGILVGQVSVIVANGVTLVIVACLAVLKLSTEAGPGRDRDLLPCPFCGHQRVGISRSLRDGYEDDSNDPDANAYFGCCSGCAAQGGWTKSETGAIRLWNQRAGRGRG